MDLEIIAPDAVQQQVDAAAFQQAAQAQVQQAAAAAAAQVQAQAEFYIAQQQGAAINRIEQLEQELLNTRTELQRRTTGALPPAEPVNLIPRSFKIPTPDCFHGKKGEDCDGFVHQLEEHFSLAGVTNDIQRIRLAALCLRGAARTWYTSTNITWEDGEIMTWERFKEELHAHFSPLNQSKLARDKLHSLVQDSSVADYTHQFRILAVKVTDLSQSERYHRYVGGLKHFIRREIELRQDIDETFEAAARFAEKFDRTNATYRSTDRPFKHWRPNQPSNGSSDSRSSHRPAPMDLDVMQTSHGSEPRRGPLTQDERDRRRAQGLCAYCGSDRHLVDACPLSTRNKGGPKNGMRRPPPRGVPHRQ
jgi:hypothetical protein